MTAYSVVRFRVKSGQEPTFEALFREMRRDFPGFRKGALVRAADGSYFSVGEWQSQQSLAEARPGMIGNLDRFRHTLESIDEGGSVTEAVSGEALIEIAGTA